MGSLVLIDCDTGALRRFEVGGTRHRLTHKATPINGPTDLTPKMIEQFRVNPGPDFAVEPPPQPPLPPASAMPKPRVG